jgi:hypothetical protein
MIMHTTDNDRQKLTAYAWPGGYPVMYLARDGWREENGALTLNRYDRSENACCAKCACDTVEWPDLVIVASYVHYEGAAEYCEYCNGVTESAYGETEAETEGIAL